jgi:hypothetical protein
MRYCVCAMLLVTYVLCAGCGSSLRTLGVQGEVSFDGRAVERGTIDFLPVDSTASWSAGAPIVNGRYEIPAKAGLLPDGAYLVRICGLRKTGTKAVAPKRMLPQGTSTVDAEENYIPPIYNTDSTLKVRVADVPDKSKVDFRLGRMPAATPN